MNETKYIAAASGFRDISTIPTYKIKTTPEERIWWRERNQQRVESMRDYHKRAVPDMGTFWLIDHYEEIGTQKRVCQCCGETYGAVYEWEWLCGGLRCFSGWLEMRDAVWRDDHAVWLKTTYPFWPRMTDPNKQKKQQLTLEL